MLLEAFVEGRLPIAAFEAAVMRLWSADRDSEWAIIRRDVPATPPLPDRACVAEDLMAQACAGGVQPADFGLTWASIWALKATRPRVVVNIINLLHGYTYRYTPDSALRAEKPAFYLDEAQLRSYMVPLRDVLAVMMDDD